MKLPGISSTFWFISFVAVSLLFLRQTQLASNEAPDVWFASKYFWNNADATVEITGTLTGEGVSYKNNTTIISCHKDRGECWITSIIGGFDSPYAYPITKWNAYEIVATEDVADFNCSQTTISLERKLETAVWVIEPINQSRANCKDSNTKIYKWTIEDPPYWHRGQR